MADSARPILVTGATGFLGYRLTECLSLGLKLHVRALAHSRSTAGLARLARLPVSIVWGDLLDQPSLTEAAKGCFAVVHCAFGTKGSTEQIEKTTIEGTRNIFEAAVEVGVERLVHLSTSAVNGYRHEEPVLDESTPYSYRTADGSKTYINSKIEAEKVATSYTREIPTSILRPTRIYGPRSQGWTAEQIKRIKASSIVLINEGIGIAQFVYVDNVIDAIILALHKDEALGETLIVTDDERLTWKQFYTSLASLIPGNVPPFVNLSISDVQKTRRKRKLALLGDSWRGLSRLVKDDLVDAYQTIPLVRTIARILPESFLGSLGRQLSSESPQNQESSSNFPLPDRYTIESQTCTSWFTNAKLKRLLGWRQRVSFSEGMALTGKWLAYNRLI